MAKIPETALILNKDGSVYHLNLLPNQIADTIIAVGDPNRVNQVSKFFQRIDFEINQREFITHTGSFNGKKLSVISTGIGTDNIEIFLTELDALVNIDLKTREIKPKRRSLKIIRLGTSGALQEDIQIGASLVSEYAIGLDNLMHFYDLPQTDFERSIGLDIQAKTSLPFAPYVVNGSKALQQQVGFDMIVGNTVTTPGFYAPQGRAIRIPIKYDKLLEELNYYHNEACDFWLTNFEMETAGYYALGRLLGHEIISVNAILANRIKNQFAKDPVKIMDQLIVKVLERL